MNKEKATLIANFIGIAGRYLEGGAENPKFQPIVAWALQNYPLLYEDINEAQDFSNWRAEQQVKGNGEVLNLSIENQIYKFIEARGLNLNEKAGIESEYYRRRNERKKIPEDLADEIEDILIHTQTKGAYL